MSGRLFLVGTPIGNLEDISARALRVLKDVNGILAEDTRHSAKLLRHYGIATPLSAWHAHNEAQRLDAVLSRLAAGEDLALISDAGMPLISDPGFPLVRAARDAGYAVECVPGPTALIAALVLSGFPAERFVFEGFLPARGPARREHLSRLAAETRTVILYESPHRLADCLADIAAVMGAERPVCLARELTKRFESVYQDTAAALASWAQAPGEEGRGEFVVLIRGLDEAPIQHALDADRVLRELLAELPARKAAKITARLCGGSANEYYARSLQES